MERLNHHAIDNGDVEFHPSEFPVEPNYEYIPDPDTTQIKSIDDDEMDHLLEFFYLEHDDDLLDVELHMIQAWLVVSPPSNIYTVSNVLFHKDKGANFSVTNCMSQFSMFSPTKATVKLDNENTGHAQVIGIILCSFHNFSIIYPVGPVYYWPGHPYNTILSGALKFYVGFQKVKYELLEHCDFFNPQGLSWRSPHQTKKNKNYNQIGNFKVNPQINRDIVVPNVCAINKISLSLFICSLVMYLLPS